MTILEFSDALPNREAWTEKASCAEVGGDHWYPEKGGSTREAKRVCLGCPVRAVKLGGSGECLEYALKNQERFGIWGGYTEHERRRLKAGDDVRPVNICVRGHDTDKLGRTAGGSCAQCHRDRVNESHRRRRGIA